MRIAILVEGNTETAFKPVLIAFLKTLLPKAMPKLDFVPYHGAIPTGEKLKRVVFRLLNDKKKPADAVIALTDLYPGYKTAKDAIQEMQSWVGKKETRFHPHVAQHDFEAWLLPYWPRIIQLSGSNHKPPGSNPETVNHSNPPAHRLHREFETGPKRVSYIKTRDVGRILAGQELMIAIQACPQFKAFINTILLLCDPSKMIE